MNDFGLPDDCFEFLKQGLQLDFDPEQCEAGAVLLRSTDELKRERLPVETYPSSFRDEDPLRNEEGHYDEYGFYYVLAVSLTKGDYVPEAVLFWLPKEQVFATYDESHHDVLLFPNATWTQIVASPLLYINALWEGERSGDLVSELKPWLAHPFCPGLTLPEVSRNKNVISD